MGSVIDCKDGTTLSLSHVQSLGPLENVCPDLVVISVPSRSNATNFRDGVLDCVDIGWILTIYSSMMMVLWVSDNESESKFAVTADATLAAIFSCDLTLEDCLPIMENISLLIFVLKL